MRYEVTNIGRAGGLMARRVGSELTGPGFNSSSHQTFQENLAVLNLFGASSLSKRVVDKKPYLLMPAILTLTCLRSWDKKYILQ